MPCRTSRPEIRGGKAGTERSYCDYLIPAVAPLRWSYGTLKPRFGGAFLSAILGLGHCIALAGVRVAPRVVPQSRRSGPPLAEGRAVARRRPWISEYRITVARSRDIAPRYQS
jgi:hypothetical protein